MDQLDNLLGDIQQHCDDVALDMFGEATRKRWSNPGYAGRMEKPDGEGELIGDCGDTIRIHLTIQDDKVEKALFFTTGCGASIVSADMCCELATGKTVDEASEISGEDILKGLDKMPADKTHCAHLASSALQEALGNWLEKKNRI